MMNGYNFTESVRRVLAASREEAAVLRHEYVGTEHILLALLRIEGTVAQAALLDLCADLAAMRDLITRTVKPGRPDTVGPDLPYTSRAARVRETLAGMATGGSEPITPDDMLQLDQSLLDAMERERAAARAPSLSTAHLALALLDEGCAVAPAFGACGVTQASFREELARISG